jgi:hypothetical protein
MSRTTKTGQRNASRKKHALGFVVVTTTSYPIIMIVDIQHTKLLYTKNLPNVMEIVPTMHSFEKKKET